MLVPQLLFDDGHVRAWHVISDDELLCVLSTTMDTIDGLEVGRHIEWLFQADDVGTAWVQVHTDHLQAEWHDENTCVVVIHAVELLSDFDVPVLWWSSAAEQ